MQLIPKIEGEIGSVAQVLFQAKATARSVSTRPQIQVRHAAPRQVLIGNSIALDITVTNSGSGIAEGIVLEEDVPPGFTHPAGNMLEYEIGSLRPGETRKLELSLTAAKAGAYRNQLRIHGEGNLADQDALDIEVIAPTLELALQGPSRRYLDRQATYTLTVANPGTAAATNVDLVTYMPKGFKFVESDNQGKYDSRSHSIHWNLEELPANRLGEVKLTAIPVETGEQVFRVEAKADLDLSATTQHVVRVDSLSELTFSIADLADPIEKGSETTYEIRVRNHGSKADSNIRLAALLPDELQPLAVDGPTRGTINGQRVDFEPVARLAPNDEAVFRFNARGNIAGDHVIRVQVASDEATTPVTKEESTRVYEDR
jgi:uncharacterized repeat protein (TIGR01451 family)